MGSPYPAGLSSGRSSPTAIRGLARRLLTHPWVLRGAAALSGGHATICFLHRFSEREDGSGAFPVPALRSHLEWLRANRYRLIGLGALVDELREGKPIAPRTVVFTIDDGFADFHQLASPVFAEFECPATVFLVTGFVDDRAWLWWNRIEHGFAHAPLAACRREVNGMGLDETGGEARLRHAAAEAVTERLKWLTAEARAASIDGLLARLEVDIPAQPTAAYTPMTWPEIRALNGELFSFGPHTVTHPILALEGDARARDEITRSWSRVRTEVPDAVPVFCFPNGDPRSFGARELKMLAEAGLLASVSTRQESVSSRNHLPEAARLAAPLPRFQVEAEAERFVQVVSGVDRLKGFLRGRR